MGQFSADVFAVVNLTRRATAPDQAGLLTGVNPIVYNTSDPFRIWVVQVAIIVIFTQLLAVAFTRIRQPRVLAEIIGGIILGPSVMGNIPGFSNAIFPQAAMPLLSLTSTVGLVFFLFLVGMELDVSIMRRNWRGSAAVSVVGLVIPLGLGAALAVPIYHQFSDPSVNYGNFILFVAVAVGITAFPVLCRILTELRLLDTTVGVVTLSAGIGNDVVGWILLALSVALVNTGSGQEAAWVFLVSVGYVLLLLYPVRLSFLWLARRTGSLESASPTPLMMTVTFLMVLLSALFTDIIGVHAIFGGFLAGVIIPKEGGFAIALTEKLEDLICLIFLPLYFTFSGLGTNFTTLNNGITWGYVVLICVVAFFAKFLGCGISARLTGFNNRESGAIGTLMACKGLVEIIVLNVGLSAGILNTRVFSMFVFHAIVLTAVTTPLTLLWYPTRFRSHFQTAIIPPKVDTSGKPRTEIVDQELKSNIAVILQRIDQLPASMTLTQMLQRPSKFLAGAPESPTSSDVTPTLSLDSHQKEKSKAFEAPTPSVSVSALRLIELSDRTSAVLKSQHAESLIHRDSVVSTFKTFAHLNRIPFSAALFVVPEEEMVHTTMNHIHTSGAQMAVIPWSSHVANMEDLNLPALANNGSSLPTSLNPFDQVFKTDLGHTTTDTQYVRKVFSRSPVDVALFVDRGIANSDAGHGYHLFLPFFGGPDDRLALSFVVQLCHNPSITASVVRIKKTDVLDISRSNSNASIKVTALDGLTQHQQTSIMPDTIYHQSTQFKLASATADGLLWGQFSQPSESHTPALADALKRITFHEEEASKPLRRVLEISSFENKSTIESWKSLVVVVGRGRRMANDGMQSDLKFIMNEHGSANLNSDTRRTLGDVASAFVTAGTMSGLLVLQAARTESEQA